MPIQQNRFPMGKSDGTNWWPWIIFIGLLATGYFMFRRNTMPALETEPEPADEVTKKEEPKTEVAVVVTEPTTPLVGDPKQTEKEKDAPSGNRSNKLL